MAGIFVGTSGWSYRNWRGAFYPDDLAHRRELEYLTERFDTVELNRTFYSLTTANACRQWYRASPPGFVYAVKGSRFITHNKKLNDIETPLANFFASGILELRDRLGPFLWQLAGNHRPDPERLDSFLAALPRDTGAARRLARSHDRRVADPAYGDAQIRPLRHVVELRHPSSFNPEVVEILRRRETALAFSHSSVWPYAEEITTEFVYLRLHGPEALYDSEYGPSALQRWAARIEAWNAGDEPEDSKRITELDPPSRRARDVFVYFDNDGHAYAPKEAAALRRMLVANAPVRRKTPRVR